MNDIDISDGVNIESLIYEIRGMQVMLDSDLARLYEVETKQLNRQVKRNIEIFDNDFMFQLSKLEYKNLKCQIGTSSLSNYGSRRTLPYVFTEMGATTLASVLHSKVAIDIIKRLNIEVLIVTKPNNFLTEQDVEKYNKQYKNLKVIYNNTFHDRYFILDEKIVYHCGASINRIGYKTFSITVIGDEQVCNSLIIRVKEII